MRFSDVLLGAGLACVFAFVACDSTRSRFSDDDTGGSGGSSLTGNGCSSLADCPRWACHCVDGSLVYAQSCDNGRCGAALDPGMCPAACADFGGLASVDPLSDGGSSGGAGTASGGAGTASGGAGTASGGAAGPAPDGGSSGGAAPSDDGGSSSGGAAPPIDGGP